ncbi:MAG: flavodoxin [Actinomycetota bacterium]
MPTLLVVHHTPSANLRQMLDQVIDGAAEASRQLVDAGAEPVTVRAVPALEATAVDALAADGYLLGTPANLGYMSGALKHFFDTTYNDCLDVTAGRPYGLFLHGHSDTDGALSAIERIVTGLRWRAARPPVQHLGPLDEPSLNACWELGAALAAGLG